MSMEVVMLGTGTSHGVPMIGCRCEVCSSTDPHNHRTRPSIWVRAGDTCLLVDTAPELRLQCVSNGIDRVDAVLFTHHHADHVTGLDDLRRFNWLMKKAVPCYGSAATLAMIESMFAYAFTANENSPHSKPQLDLHTIESDSIMVGEVVIQALDLMHGPLAVLGFRIGSFAYCTDCNYIPSGTLGRLEGLEVLVLDALRKTPHPTHFNLEQAVDMASQIGARRTFFTHITHQLDHEATNASLPSGMALAHDGLRLELSTDG